MANLLDVFHCKHDGTEHLMGQVPMSYHYDAEEDLFSAWLRQPSEVVSTEVREGN